MFVIQHPARVDLFDSGWGEYVPLHQAKCFKTEVLAKAECEPSDIVIPKPETQPIHPIKHVN